MTPFEYFQTNSKMRYDFADQIQVRYRHVNGEEIDTWVSGEEVLQRLASAAAEEKVRRFSKFDLRELNNLKDKLPEQGKDKIEGTMINRLANEIENFIGGNMIGDNLADSVRNFRGKEVEQNDEKSRWGALLENETFRHKVIELAWIQLEGSFPESDFTDEPDDWT